MNQSTKHCALLLHRRMICALRAMGIVGAVSSMAVASMMATAQAPEQSGDRPAANVAVSPPAVAPSPAPSTQVSAPPPLSCIRPLRSEDVAENIPATRMLAQAIAQFDQGRVVVAYLKLQAALQGGLADPLEVAVAHKYLAFFYCQHKSNALCEKNFESALLAAPGFDLEPGEKKNPAWAEAYANVYRRLTTDCRAAGAAGLGSASGIFPDFPPSGIRATSAIADAQEPAPAILRFAVSPWGNVYLNGKRWITTPPVKEVQLAPGKHRIEIRNGRMRPFVQEYVFRPGDQLLLRHDF